MAEGTLAQAIAAAAHAADDEAAGARSDDGTEPEGSETDDTDPAETPALEGAQAGNEPEAAEGTETEAVEDGTEDVPTEYFGIDLSDLSAEARAKYIKGVQERDKLISKLMREKGEAPAEPATPEPVDKPEVTEKDILEALGLDMDDPYDANTAKVAVPLLARLMELSETVEGLSNTTAASQMQSHWEKTLDKLEAEYGKLPPEVTRLDLLTAAAASGTTDPVSAYWTLMGPGAVTLYKDVQAGRAAASKDGKRAATTTRPRTSAPVTPNALKSTTTRNAVKEAFELAMKEHGVDS